MAKLKKETKTKNKEKDVQTINEEIVIEEQIDDVVKETIKNTPKPKKTKKSKQELTVELNKIEEDVFVELLNVSTGRVLYMNKFEDAYVDLEPSENVAINLKQLKEICTKAKGFFSDGSLIITDVYNEEYSLDEILRFLKLDKIQMEDYDVLEELIVEEDENRFRVILEGKNRAFVKRVAAKAVYLNSSDEYDFELSRGKERIICNLLGLDDLIY